MPAPPGIPEQSPLCARVSYGGDGLSLLCYAMSLPLGTQSGLASFDQPSECVTTPYLITHTGNAYWRATPHATMFTADHDVRSTPGYSGQEGATHCLFVCISTSRSSY